MEFKVANATILPAAPSTRNTVLRPKVEKYLSSAPQERKKNSDMDVLFVDESHFSTEAYVIRGWWYRKGEDFFPQNKLQQKINFNFWRIQPPDKVFLLEERKKSDKQTFKAFLHQLIAYCPNSKTIIILDNASIHTSRYIKDFVKRNPKIEIFTLPTYSPEYNPAEQVWMFG